MSAYVQWRPGPTGGAWRIRIPYQGADGKRRMKSKTVRQPNTREGKQEAELVAAELLLEVRAAGTALGTDSKGPKTVEELMAWWIQQKTPEWSGSNTPKIKSRVKHHIVPTLGLIQASRLKPQEIRQLYTEMLNKGLSPTTVHRVHGNLRAAYRYAISHDIVTNDPTLKVTPPKRIKAKINSPDPREVAEAIRQAESRWPAYALAIRIAATTGIRQGAVVGLRWSDINDGIMTVQRSIIKTEHGLAEREGGKAGIIQTIPLDQHHHRSTRRAPGTPEQDRSAA